MSSGEKIQGKAWQYYLLGIIVLFSLGLKLYSAMYWPEANVKVNNENLKVLVANNYRHWQKGLGGRKNLGEYDGMLFVFPEVRQHTFVMRDMEFPIDIIWIKNGEIVDIAPNVPIEPGKTVSELLPYIARDESSLVLELPAGRAIELGLKIGDRIEIDS